MDEVVLILFFLMKRYKGISTNLDTSWNKLSSWFEQKLGACSSFKRHMRSFLRWLAENLVKQDKFVLFLYNLESSVDITKQESRIKRLISNLYNERLIREMVGFPLILINILHRLKLSAAVSIAKCVKILTNTQRWFYFPDPFIKTMMNNENPDL